MGDVSMNIKSLALAASSFAVLAVAFAGPAFARDQIRIVGSSTVYPFTTAVAEQFGKTSGMKTPVVESTGTGGGMKLFCAGVGAAHPDFTNASRAIKKGEFEDCQKNGVTEIVEIKVGFDGLSLANSVKGPEMKLTKQQVFQALAKQVPDKDGNLIANPYKMWSDIDPSLPAQKIEVYGPPPTSGTRDSFVELVMEKGAESFDSLKALKKSDAKAFEAVWKSMREDGPFVEAGENDNLIVQKLANNPNALGIFGFANVAENAQIRGLPINGVAPSIETIASGEYAVSRPLFVYAKKQHVGVIPGMAEFIAEFTSDKATGEDGYLVEKGLIALPGEEGAKIREAARGMVVMTADQVK
jgi:phosphate transport system substrate-binding protein